MFTIWKLTIASIKMFVRNRQALFFTFFTPLLIMVIFGVIGFDRPPHINVGVVVQGSVNPPSAIFLEQLQKVPLFSLHYGSETKERKAIENGDRAIVINLSGNAFEPDSQSKVGDITILANAGDPNSQTALSLINQMIDKARLAINQVPQLVNVSVEEINSHNLKYIDFLLPGLVAMSVMQLSVFSVAFVFVEFKERGILKRIVATPVKPTHFVIANIITRLLVALFQAAFFIAIGVIFFHVQVVGSYLLIALTVILGAIMFLGLGFTISGLSKTTDSVPAIANLVVFPMLFLGGTFFSIDTMPHWLQYIAKVLPLTFFSTPMRDIMTKGAGFADIYLNLVWMLVWAIILVGLAVYTFRFDEQR